MSIFNAIALIGGLALFLYGMNLLGEGHFHAQFGLGVKFIIH